MKYQDYLSRIIFFPTVHVKQITTSIKKTTIHVIQINIAQH